MSRGARNRRSARAGRVRRRQQATFTNPVYDGDFPDPFVLKCRRHVLRLRDERRRQAGADADVDRPRPLAARARRVAEGRLVGLQRRDLGAGGAEARRRLVRPLLHREPLRRPRGRDEAARPVRRSWPSESLVCQRMPGGSIDPSPFRDDDGTLYLLWKNDGNAIGAPTHIYAQRLSPRRLRLVGKRQRRSRRTTSRGRRASSRARCCGNTTAATSSSTPGTLQRRGLRGRLRDVRPPLGPCKDAPENPILKTTCRRTGPGTTR